MPILVSCKCGGQFQIDDQHAGRPTRCLYCDHELIVPYPDESHRMVPSVVPTFAPASWVDEPRTSDLARLSLFLGLTSFFLCLFLVGFLTGLPAIITGVIALKRIHTARGRLKGKVDAIVGILAGFVGCLVPPLILFYGVMPAREAARRSQCVCNLKCIGLAMHNYHAVWNSFPPAAIADKDGKPLLSWRVTLLPFMEQQALHEQFHLDEPWDSPHNLTLLPKMPHAYLCPSAPVVAPGATFYQVIVGPGTLFDRPEGVKIEEVQDGTANTLMAGEAVMAVNWTEPVDLTFVTNGPLPSFGSAHPDGFNALFADGSVRFIKNSVLPIVLRSYLTRSDGDFVILDPY